MDRGLAERSPDYAATEVAPAVRTCAVTSAPEPLSDHPTPGISVVPGKDRSGAHLPLTAVIVGNLGYRERPAGMKAGRKDGHRSASDRVAAALRADRAPEIHDLVAVRMLIHAA